MPSKSAIYSGIWVVGALILVAGGVDALGVFLYGGKSIAWSMLTAFAGLAICFISPQYIRREQDNARRSDAVIATRQKTLEFDVAARVQADRTGAERS